MSAHPMPRASEDMVSLSERMGYLQALRVGFVLLALASAVFAPQVVGATVSDVLLAASLYAISAASLEYLRRSGQGRNLPILSAMLLVDGAFLAWAMYLTGGTQSPLRFLVYLHLIAVALLASYRTSLKIALWHSLLFFVVFYAQAADILKPTEGALGLVPGTPEFNRISVFNVLAFWTVAIVTASLSSLNERELRRRAGDLQDLAQMSAALKEEAEPETVGHILLESVGTSFGFKRGFVAVKEGDDTAVIAFRGPGEPNEPPEGSRDVLLERALEQGAGTSLVKKPDPDENPGIAALMPFARNLLVIPLAGDQGAIGVLVLEYPERFGNRISRRTLVTIEQFAAHGALALRNSFLMKEVQKLADTDALTGLANRRTFQNALEREISRSARTGEPVTLLLLDVDHFKRFNDTHGHQAGDEVLREVGRTLKLGSREFDIPARYGGEEFAVILPECSSRESLKVAGRLRELLGGIETVE
ncbi:MAG: diguanylate cyclase, partial [Actinomycetota bacterium]